jgi:hypothetical protein
VSTISQDQDPSGAGDSDTGAATTDTGPAIPDQEASQPNAAGAESGVEPVAPVSGEGEATEVEVAASGSLRLQGRTNARFNGGSFRTTNVRTSAGSGCSDCSGGDCVHVTGTLVTDYRVTTTVTLPSVSDFPDLTHCQQDRVRDAIDNVLSPHEQQHVSAFSAYNGTTSRPFDANLCRAQFEDFVRGMVGQEEGPRRAAAQAASDALDPFSFDVDLDCTD